MFDEETASVKASNWKKYVCLVCGFIYDEERGWPEGGIPPGTRWSEVPVGWCCPECGAMKMDFEEMSV